MFPNRFPADLVVPFGKSIGRDRKGRATQHELPGKCPIRQLLRAGSQTGLPAMPKSGQEPNPSGNGVWRLFAGPSDSIFEIFVAILGFRVRDSVAEKEAATKKSPAFKAGSSVHLNAVGPTPIPKGLRGQAISITMVSILPACLICMAKNS